MPPEVLAAEPWIQEHVGNRTSVTELEILHGVLRDPAMAGHAFFYFRDSAYIAKLPAAEQAEMVERDIPDDIREFGPEEAARRTQQRKDRLAALKEAIRQSHLPLVDPYATPEALAARVRQQFLDLIDQLYPNLFRITQTEAKIRKENRRGQQSLERAAEDVGRRVRQTMQDISGNQPEDLSSAEDIKVVRKKLKSAQREFRKMDLAKPAKQISGNRPATRISSGSGSDSSRLLE